MGTMPEVTRGGGGGLLKKKKVFLLILGVWGEPILPVSSHSCRTDGPQLDFLFGK